MVFNKEPELRRNCTIMSINPIINKSDLYEARNKMSNLIFLLRYRSKVEDIIFLGVGILFFLDMNRPF